MSLFGLSVSRVYRIILFLARNVVKWFLLETEVRPNDSADHSTSVRIVRPRRTSSFPPSIKLLLISLSKLVFSVFVSLSTLSVLDSRRGTRDTEGGPTDKTRVVNSTRRKPTHLSLSTACLPETRGLLEIPTAFLACFFSVYCAGRRKSHVEIQIFCSLDKLHPRAL